MYTLHFSPGACSLAPHIVLEELGVPFELARVDFAAGGQHSAEFRAINPHGRVPALSFAGRTLVENVAILSYLAALDPARPLLPAEPVARAEALSRLVWLSGTVHGQHFASIFRPARFAEDEAAHEALKAKGRADVLAAFAEMDTGLGDGRDYACGDFSIVDPMMLVLRRWGARIGADMQAYPRLVALADRVAARPAAARALAREGIKVDG